MWNKSKARSEEKLNTHRIQLQKTNCPFSKKLYVQNNKRKVSMKPGKYLLNVL